MAFTWGPKDPNEVLKYEHDWAAVLVAGDAIVGLPLALVESGNVVVDSSTVLGTVQRVVLSGGTVKADASKERITLRINTTSGQTFDEGIRLAIKER